MKKKLIKTIMNRKNQNLIREILYPQTLTVHLNRSLI